MFRLPDAVPGGAGHDQRAAPGGVHVADPAAGAGFGSREGRNTAREIVRLGREDQVVVDLRANEWRTSSRVWRA